MRTSPSLQVISVPWESHGFTLLEIRRRVFTLEQNVPPHLEEDGRDPEALHALALFDGQAAGCGRVLPEGRIGRLCVLPEYRRRGIGTALFAFLFERARELPVDHLILHAQLHVVDLYARFGFVVVGEPFLDAGIVHREMIWERCRKEHT